MSEQYGCPDCNYVEYIDKIPIQCPKCGHTSMDHLRWTKGGANGYHWDGCEEVHLDCKIAQLEAELARRDEIIKRMKEKLAREHQVSDALYLLLVDDPNTKLKAEQILIDIYGKCETSPSDSDVSVTQDVLMDIKTGQSIEKVECSWIQEDDPEICYWKTGCGNSFYFTEGTPTDNHMKFCCYCGKLLKQEE